MEQKIRRGIESLSLFFYIIHFDVVSIRSKPNEEIRRNGQKIRTSGQFFLKRAEKFIIINVYDLKTKIRDFLL